MAGSMSDNRDILVKARQQAAVCKEQGFPETCDFLTALADEIEALRLQLRIRVMDAADSVVRDNFTKRMADAVREKTKDMRDVVNGHG